MICGAPGTGKTTWARMLAQSRDPDLPRIAASDFCLPSDIVSLSPLKLVESVCSQLASARPEFEVALRETASRGHRNVSIHVAQTANDFPGSQMVGVHIHQLNLGVEAAEDALHEALVKPLSRAAASKPLLHARSPLSKACH